MGNCLVTKLKGVVDNDNLPLFDKIQVKFLKNASENPNIRFNVGMETGETSTITSKAGTLLNFDSKQSIQSQVCGSFGGSNATTTSTAGDILYADNMYKIKVFYLGSNVGAPAANSVEFDFNQLRYLNLQRFYIEGSFVEKQFNDFSFLEGSVESLEKLEIGYNGTHWEDVDLMYFTKFTHLTTIDIGATWYKPMDFKQFALGQIAAGRTSGSIRCSIATNQIFDGEPATAGNHMLVWTSAEDITFDILP